MNGNLGGYSVLCPLLNEIAYMDGWIDGWALTSCPRDIRDYFRVPRNLWFADYNNIFRLTL